MVDRTRWREGARRAPWVSTALTAGLACCSPAADSSDRSDTQATPNLLLITVDTLRADHLGLHGYERPTSPNLDRFAEGAVVFEAAQASSSWTLPGIASIMTSFYTSTHGCWNGRSRLAPSFETLAERLGGAGFRTGAVVNHVFLDRRYGLDQGFEDYDDELIQESKAESHLAVSAPGVTDKALAWLGQPADGADRPWLLWVHYFDPHHVYQSHAGISEDFGMDAPVDLYDGEIAFTDAHLGRLLDGLSDLGLAQDTVVVVVADHGEEFGDHGGTGHRNGLYGEVQRIPMIVRSPGCEPRRVASTVSMVDLGPTVLELLGLEAPPLTAGRSLMPAMFGGALDNAPVLAELGFNTVAYESVIAGDWKLILDHEEERELLFDLAADPGETTDLSAEHPERVQRLEQELRRLTERGARWSEEFAPIDDLELTPRDLRNLGDLGYIEGLNDMPEDE